ncbi:hypothetical protein M422DRAFT_264021 [Sphaerobolus stellatus SS14]|uniref:Purine-cytosine permease n=1 Tax=Sphaerobolus stellatus (strain SS14) TaxID=990650 RepID=A0A0C9V8W9_SPHS4|nr:hypothetical protein M422DRAFT_264021 [Sphaerobolus stellatus SS14]
MGWDGCLMWAVVEARGIERVPESERQNKHSIGLLLLWFSVNIALTTIPLGMLGQQIFTLSFADTVRTMLGFLIIGCFCVVFIATLGPKTGMRTMVITRYSYGYWGGAIISLLNVLTQLGLSVIVVILAGQVLHNINTNMLLVVGCYIRLNLFYWIRLPTPLRTLRMDSYDNNIPNDLGYWWTCWYAHHSGFDINRQKPLEDPPGRLRAADALSYGGIMFASSSGWAPVAADFNCRLTSNTPKKKIFWLTFFGVLLPIFFVGILGAALVTVPQYSEAFEEGDAAGVLKKGFEPWGGGGDFILVLMALSVVGNNTRILGCFWIVIVTEEHYIFRRKGGMLGGYDFRVYDSPKELPLGLAAIIASCISVAGIVIGMAQVWFIGPVAAKIGPFGGDLGFEFAAVFAAVLFPPLRYLEIRRWGR